MSTERQPSPQLDPALVEILVCPEDHGALHYLPSEAVLYNPRLHRAYEVRDGIAVMLIDEARTVDDAEHARLMGLVGVVAPTDDAADRA